MEQIKKRNRQIANISAVVLFAVIAVACGVMFWNGIIKNMFTVTDDTIATVAETPIGYVVLSFVFVAVLCALNLFGYFLKNRFMVILAALYELLLAAGIILLVFFSLGKITGETLNSVVMWSVMIVMSPVYGFIYIAGVWSFLAFVPLAVCSVAGLVLLRKKNKS